MVEIGAVTAFHTARITSDAGAEIRVYGQGSNYLLRCVVESHRDTGAPVKIEENLAKLLFVKNAIHSFIIQYCGIIVNIFWILGRKCYF